VRVKETFMLKPAHDADGTEHPVHLGGWKRQAKDTRDEGYRLKLHGSFLRIPTSWDNRPFCSPVENQGALGSCTANMFAALVESNALREGAVLKAVPRVQLAASPSFFNKLLEWLRKLLKPAPTPAPTPSPNPDPTPAPKPPRKFVNVSRLFGYYATRKIQGTIEEDSGASIRDTIKAGVKYGVADELDWPYDIGRFAEEPPAALWEFASRHKVTSYHAIADGDIATMKSILSMGSLIGFGFDVYDYFMSSAMAREGFLRPPSPGETFQGGHAVTLVGYDDEKQAFLVRNSWGTRWGLNGYFWMSYDYVANTALCSDFWVVKSAPV